MIEVYVKHRGGDEQHYMFDKSTIMLGRALGNDIRLDSSGASRFHARISLLSNRLTIKDLESSNGTYVDGQKVASQELSEHQEIVIGDAKIRIKLRGVELESSEEPVLVETVQPSIVEASFVEVDRKEEVVTTKENITNSATIYSPRLSSLNHISSNLLKYFDADTKALTVNSKGWVLKFANNNDDAQSLIQLDRSTIDSIKGELLSSSGVLKHKSSYLSKMYDDSYFVSAYLDDTNSSFLMRVEKSPLAFLSINELVHQKVLSTKMCIFLFALLKLKKNVVIAGGDLISRISLLSAISELLSESLNSLIDKNGIEIVVSNKDLNSFYSVKTSQIEKLNALFCPSNFIILEANLKQITSLFSCRGGGTILSSPVDSLSGLCQKFNGQDVYILKLDNPLGRGVCITSLIESTIKDNKISNNAIFHYGRKSPNGTNSLTFYETGYLPKVLKEFRENEFEEAISIFPVNSKS